MTDCPLDSVTLALVALAANIAANHPKKGLCQLERLRGLGVSEDKIALVIEVARHLRDEAGQMLDAEFERAFVPQSAAPAATPVTLTTATADACGCSVTAAGARCC